MYKSTQTIEKNLREKFPAITIWEHDFDKLAKTTNLPRIDDRGLPLRPRDAMFGGRTETFIAFNQNEIEAKNFDITSL